MNILDNNNIIDVQHYYCSHSVLAGYPSDILYKHEMSIFKMLRVPTKPDNFELCPCQNIFAKPNQQQQEIWNCITSNATFSLCNSFHQCRDTSSLPILKGGPASRLSNPILCSSQFHTFKLLCPIYLLQNFGVSLRFVVGWTSCVPAFTLPALSKA